MKMKLEVLVIVVVACGLLFCSCSVKLDFSSLKFEEEGASGDAGTLPDIAEVPDVPAIDRGSPEEATSPEEVGPAPGIECWPLFRCVLDKGCNDFKDSCFTQCADGEEWMKSQTVKQLKHCMSDCSEDNDYGGLPYCLQAECISQLVYCASEADGEESCGDSLLCYYHDCEGEGDAWDEFNCMMECMSETDGDEAQDLLNMWTDCGQESDDAYDCTESSIDCLGDSGSLNKTCYEAADCMLSDCKEECPPGDDGCPDSTRCLLECGFGMPQDSADLLWEFLECGVDAEANPFDCLLAYLDCYYSHSEGNSKCGPVAKSIQLAYGAPGLFMDQFWGMVGAAATINLDHIDSLMTVLDCLVPLWNEFPGYGKIPNGAWNDCASHCQ